MERYSRFVEDVTAHYLGLTVQTEVPRLYRNRGDGTFEDVTGAVGLDQPLFAMGSNFGDLDNDGFPDMYLGTGEPELQSIIPNRMFRNDHGLRFLDVRPQEDSDIYKRVTAWRSVISITMEIKISTRSWEVLTKATSTRTACS